MLRRRPHLQALIFRCLSQLCWDASNSLILGGRGKHNNIFGYWVLYFLFVSFEIFWNLSKSFGIFWILGDSELMRAQMLRICLGEIRGQCLNWNLLGAIMSLKCSFLVFGAPKVLRVYWALYTGFISRRTKVQSRAVFGSVKPNWLLFSFMKFSKNWQFWAKNGFKLHNN